MKIKKILTTLAVVMLFVCMFGLTVSAEDGGMYYAPYYDAETDTVVGAPEVGDWVPAEAVFSGANLSEDMLLEVLTYNSKAGADEDPDNAMWDNWDSLEYYEERMLDFEGVSGDPAGGWVVKAVEYYNYEWGQGITILGYFVNEPEYINVDVSIDWSKIGYFRIGKELPVTASGFYAWEAEDVYDSCDGGFLIKVTSEILEKTGILDEDYEDEDYLGKWISADAFIDYEVSATDEFCYNFDLHADDKRFSDSWDDVDISDNVTIKTAGISLHEAYAYGYMGKGDVAEITVYLGTAEEIIEKAGIDNDVQNVGWKKIGDLWYYFDSNGNLVKNQWVKDSVGWCYLGDGGFMLTNEFVDDSKGTCYVGADGYIVYNKWVKDQMYHEVYWYYIGADGYMVKNQWVKDSVGWCYVGEWGMETDQWIKDSKGYVYVDESGYMVTNQWVDSWEGLYYVNGSGYRVTNQWKQYDGNWVYLGKDGQALTDQWVKDSVGWCYVDYNGFMVYDQWVEDSVGWCYVGSNGYLVTNGWVFDEFYGEWCYMNASGYMTTDKWVKDSVGWCYLDSEGYMMRDAWVKDSVGVCYVDSSGYMVTNDWVKTDGDTYYMNGSGYRTTGWKYIESNWYYFYEDGVMARDTYIGSDYVDEDGVWVE